MNHAKTTFIRIGENITDNEERGMNRSIWSDRKILRDEKWSRTYEAEDGAAVNVSKFLTDDINIAATHFRMEWASWDDSEKLTFAHAFRSKPQFSAEDEKILDFLMAVTDERVWVSIATCLPRHSQRKEVLAFLLRCVSSGSEPKANYIRALNIMGDAEAIAGIKALHSHLSAQLTVEGSRADVRLIFDFVPCCSALAKLERSTVYSDQIRAYLNHPDRNVRDFSKVYLEGGPPTR
jgi:hypothetical protein